MLCDAEPSARRANTLKAKHNDTTGEFISDGIGGVFVCFVLSTLCTQYCIHARYIYKKVWLAFIIWFEGNSSMNWRSKIWRWRACSHLAETAAWDACDAVVIIIIVIHCEHWIEFSVVFIQCRSEGLEDATVWQPIFQFCIGHCIEDDSFHIVGHEGASELENLDGKWGIHGWNIIIFCLIYRFYVYRCMSICEISYTWSNGTAELSEIEYPSRMYLAAETCKFHKVIHFCNSNDQSLFETEVSRWN